MKITGPDINNHVSVGAACSGYRLEAVTLYEHDLRALALLQPETLRHWLLTLACKFPPHQEGDDMSDPTTEALIQSKGLTAPRVTPARIEEIIAATYYFTAADALLGRAPIAKELELLTLCVMVLKNGFTIVGKSACASAENFDAEVGQKVARADAIAQIWPLEGYLLRQQLHEATSERPRHVLVEPGIDPGFKQ